MRSFYLGILGIVAIVSLAVFILERCKMKTKRVEGGSLESSNP
jgi:hypothetical protein